MVETFLGVQVISVFFALFMMYLVRLHYKRGNLGRREFFTWNGVWVVFIVFTFMPHLLSPILTRLSIVRALDLLMIVAFMILTYIIFMDHIAIRDLYRKINQMVSDKSQKYPQKSSKK
ncbi:hypothetical protein A2397_05120 [Candidatus Amesbacteria bacterium RIFOXYB1_FULL_44_23]|uniref:DUF2304 domain-containing protein n=1 Tax=Candidatus Amesbacteria bacterium RIFOXYB1_FULL_44_23 TaxID=1797263 RepID=A0A1F4ZS53_9BACT|nr:MAG: hypothetical protein A2397_05120 [Candidatus Amesbacteria bacterium RIFOXYB1_FULL_44_23]